MDLGSCYLGGNDDAVEFCPHRPFRHVLAAATYTLQEQEQEQDRAGTVSLFSVDAEAEEASQRLQLMRTVETAGVFYMKWSPKLPLLAQADARGRLALRRLEQDNVLDTDSSSQSIWYKRKIGAGTNHKTRVRALPAFDPGQHVRRYLAPAWTGPEDVQQRELYQMHLRVLEEVRRRGGEGEINKG